LVPIDDLVSASTPTGVKGPPASLQKKKKTFKIRKKKDPKIE